MTLTKDPFTDKNLIVTIAINGKDNFTCTQKEYTFKSAEDCLNAKTHYGSDKFCQNIEAAGAFAKVDCYSF
jgi:hypothetical protein